MRRRAGLGAIQQQQLEAEKYKDKGTILQESQLEQMTKQMEVFREKLEEFAVKHKNDIRKNAQFRRQFQEMCAAIGVDPLASGKGFWSVLGMGDFYYELGVQVVEVCLAANHKTGGFMELSELRRRLIAARGQKSVHQEITEEDILMATKKLKIFGDGFIVYPIGKGKYMVQSIPGELSLEETSILTAAADTELGFVTKDLIVTQLGWTEFRAQQALDKVVGEGLCWVDQQDEPISYWFPSLFPVNKVFGTLNEDYIESNDNNFPYEIIQQWTGSDIELKCLNIFHEFDIRWYFQPCNIDSYKRICKKTNNDNSWMMLSSPCDLNNCNRSTLHIRNATENNTGLYRCVTYPYSTQNTRTIEIQVQTYYVDIKNYTVLSSESVQSPTFIENLSTNITTTIYSKVILQCRVYSRLHTTIRWFHLKSFNENNYNEQNIDSYILEYFNRTYKRLESPKTKIIAPNVYLSKVILEKVTQKDTGSYACVAINIRGHNIFEIYLQVRNDDMKSNLINFLLLFLMPIGLVLLPVPLWIIFILNKRYSNKKMQKVDNSNYVKPQRQQMYVI